MLRAPIRMSSGGLVTGQRDALTRYTRPLTGSYYFVPAADNLLRLRSNEPNE